MEAYRGIVHDGIVVLDKETQMPEGTNVIVTPVVGSPGSSAAILAAMDAAPRVPIEWVNELEQVIAQGRRPPAHLDLFADEHGGQGSR